MLSISEGPGPSGRRFSRLSMGSGGRYLLPAGELVARDVLAPTGDRVQSGMSACRIFFARSLQDDFYFRFGHPIPVNPNE